MAEKVEILKIEVDQKSAEQALRATSKQIVDLKKRQDELRKAIKETGDETGEYSAELAKNSSTLQEAQRQQRALTKEINTEKNSLNQLRANLINLKRERDNINTSTKEGAARFQELTKRIKEQNDSIKEAEQAGGDFRRNVGNYTESVKEAIVSTGLLNGNLNSLSASSLPAVGKGLAGATRGFGLLKAAIISTGIGALLVALGSLVTFFTKTEKGARLLEQATAALGAVFDELLGLVAGLGETIFEAVSNPQQAVKDLGQAIVDFINRRIQETIEGVNGLGRAFVKLFQGDFKGALEEGEKAVVNLTTGLNPLAGAIKDNIDEINDFAKSLTGAARAASDLAKAQQLLFDAETAAIVPTARLTRQIEELKLAGEDQSKTNVERINSLQQAITATNRLFDIESRLARQRTANIRQEIANTPDILVRAELERELQQAIAAQEEVEAQRASRLKETNNQLQALIKTQQSYFDQVEEISAPDIELEDEFNVPGISTDTDALLESLSAQEDLYEQYYQNIAQLQEDEVLNSIELERRKEAAKAQILAGSLDIVKQISSENAGVQKALGIFDATINTYTAITKTLASLPFPANLAASAVIAAQGFLQVSRIAQAQVPGFAEGGLIKSGVPIKRGNGDDRLITAKTGEVVLNRRQQIALGGDSTFRRLGVPGFQTGGLVTANASNDINSGFNQTDAIISSIRNMSPVVRISDVKKVMTRVNVVDTNTSL